MTADRLNWKPSATDTDDYEAGSRQQIAHSIRRAADRGC